MKHKTRETAGGGLLMKHNGTGTGSAGRQTSCSFRQTPHSYRQTGHPYQ